MHPSQLAHDEGAAAGEVHAIVAEGRGGEEAIKSGADLLARELNHRVKNLFAVVLAMLPLVGIMLYFVATANTCGAPGRAMFLSVSGLQILIVIGLGATWLLDRDEFNMLDAAAVWVGAMMVVCIALWRLNLAVEPAGFKHGRETLAWRVWASGTLPFFLAGSASVMLIQAPFLVLGWIHASGREAAMFAAAAPSHGASTECQSAPATPTQSRRLRGVFELRRI